MPNPLFIRFLHCVIAKYGSKAPGFAEEVKRSSAAWVYLSDGRIRGTPGGVPLEELLGWFEMRDGQAVSYHSNAKHLLLNDNGFFVLDPWLFDRLVEEALACG